MIIKINETQYNNLNESVGVPTHIVDVARQVFNKIMSGLKPTTKLSSYLNKTIKLKGDFQINDYKFNTINLRFDYDDINNYNIPVDIEPPKVLLRGMTHHGTVDTDATFNFKPNRNFNNIDLSISLSVGPDTTTQDLVDEFNKKKVVMVSSLAHELKHGYDESVIQKIYTHQRVDYKIGSQRRFGNIPPLNNLLSYMYFAHTTENLVRATELYAALEESGISREEFYKFLTNHKVYENYRKGANLTYEGLRDELKSTIPKIKETFDDNNMDYPENVTDDEMVDFTLKKFYEVLLDWKEGGMHELLLNDFREHIFGFQGAKREYFENYLKKIKRFGDNYGSFIKYEIKQINNICYKMMKKLSKLYSLIQDKNPQQ
jgi:hypothetical protein